MRPEFSVTFHPTIDVTEETKLLMHHELMATGLVICSPFGAAVWALTEMCQRKYVPYEVAIAKDKDGKIKHVAVAVGDGNIDYQAPRGWILDVVESYKGLGHQVRIKAAGELESAPTAKPELPLCA